MDPADLIEENLDHLIYWMEIWQFAHVDECINNPEKLLIIQEFVAWCADEGKEAIDTPRGKDGTSFRQRREQTPGWWKKETK